MAKRKQMFAYNEDYLKFRFTSMEVESNHEKCVDKALEVFKEKEHQVKRSRIDHPATREGVAYSGNTAVRASFAVAWKIARAKAPHTGGENSIKLAAVERARIMCGGPFARKLANGSSIKRHRQAAYPRTLR